MQDNICFLHPLIVNHLEYNIQPHTRKNIMLNVVCSYSFQDISSTWDPSDWQCAIIKCCLLITPKKDDSFRLKMEVSAIFECNTRNREKNSNTDFKSIVQEEGINQFTEKLKPLIAELTKLFGYRELHI